MGDSPMTRSYLLIGVVALFSAIALAKEGHTDEPETGLALLNSQAAKLREKSREAHAKEWAPVDNIFNSLGSAKADKQAEEKEEKAEDKEVEQTPEELGFPTFGNDGLPNLNLLQQQDSDWKPSGQADLVNELKEAHQHDEKEKMKADGLSGDHLLSSAGLKDDSSQDPDSSDFGDLQLVQAQDTDTDWVPKGQASMHEQMQAAEEEDEKQKLKDDGLKGSHLLSSAGLAKDDDDIQFVQEDDSESKPKGQSGIKHQINVLKDQEHKKKLKEDGLKGNHLLSSAGLKDSEDHQDEAEETMFIQQWKPNPLIGAKDGDDADDQPQLSADSDTSEDEKEDEEMEKLSDAALPSDILGASNMAHVKKKHDDLSKIGVLTVDDLDI